MAKIKRGKITTQLLIAFGAFLLAVFVSVLELVKQLELRTLDARFQYRGTVDVSDSDIIIIGIDDQTYDELPERYPFPREYYARMIRNLMRAGAKMVVFDVQFTEPDLKSTRGDSILAQSVKEAGRNIVLAGKVLEERNPYIEETIKHVYKPIDVLLETGSEWGIVNEPNDPDGFTRRYLLFQPLGEKTYLPIGLKAVKLEKGYSDTVSVYNDHDYFYFGDLKIPRIDGHTMLVNYCGPAKTFPTFPFSDILDDAEFDLRKGDTDYMETFFGAADLPPEFAALLQNPFKDKIVLLGATIEEQKDTFFSPYYGYKGVKEKTPGVEYHANAIWTILNEKFIRTLSVWHIWGLMLALALITMITVHYLKPVGGLAAMVIEMILLALLAV